MRALDKGAHLAKLNEELRRVGRQDEDVGVGLDEDAGLFLVGVAQLFAGEDSGGYLLFQVGGGGNARAVGAFAAEAGEELSGRCRFARLTLTFHGHGQQEGEGVLACSGWAGEDQRMGQAASGDGRAQRFNRVPVAEECVEACGECGRGMHGVELLSSSIYCDGQVSYGKP